MFLRRDVRGEYDARVLRRKVGPTQTASAGEGPHGGRPGDWGVRRRQEPDASGQGKLATVL